MDNIVQKRIINCFTGEVQEEAMKLTPEEITAMQAEAKRFELMEKSRPMTEMEVLSMLIPQQINSLAVDDSTALRMVAYYPDWTAGTAYAAGDRVVYNGDLYKVLQAHTSQETWLPGTGTESLYTRIDEQHDGSKYDPIPYSGNMTLEAGKYYSQYGKTYLCNRDTGNPVYHALSELVGLYVEVSE